MGVKKMGNTLKSGGNGNNTVAIETLTIMVDYSLSSSQQKPPVCSSSQKDLITVLGMHFFSKNLQKNGGSKDPLLKYIKNEVEAYLRAPEKYMQGSPVEEFYEEVIAQQEIANGEVDRGSTPQN